VVLINSSRTGSIEVLGIIRRRISTSSDVQGQDHNRRQPMDDSGKFVLQLENRLKSRHVTPTLRWRMTSTTENSGSDFQ
jgi:hypothetical protein